MIPALIWLNVLLGGLMVISSLSNHDMYLGVIGTAIVAIQLLTVINNDVRAMRRG